MDFHRLQRWCPHQVSLNGATLAFAAEIKYLGVWLDSSLSWRRQIAETVSSCMMRLKSLRRLAATHWGLHPSIMAFLIKAIVFPRLLYGATAWGSAVQYQNRIAPLDRVLRYAAILTLGLLSSTSQGRALAACGWLPAELMIRQALMRFLVRQSSYGRNDLLALPLDPGMNQIISTADIGRQELRLFRRMCPSEAATWTRISRTRTWTRPPWEHPEPVDCYFPPRATSGDQLLAAMQDSHQTWVFTDGSVMGQRSGASAVFVDPITSSHAEVGIYLGPLQASTDAEVAGLHLAVRQLMAHSDWSRATIVSDSSAALHRLIGSPWRRDWESLCVLREHIHGLQERGQSLSFWWVPGHCDIAGNEAADRAAKAAVSAGTPQGEFWVSPYMMGQALQRWYERRVRAQEYASTGFILDDHEDPVIHSDLRWTRLIPTRRGVALTAQFITGHFPTAAYLASRHLCPSGLCEACGVLATREHLLLDCDCHRYHREELSNWLHSVASSRPQASTSSPPWRWSWEFLVTTNPGRLWLARFLVRVWPRHSVISHQA